MIYVCGYVIEFSDGGYPEETILHEGTLEECECIGDIIPAVLYSGDRPIKEARFVIVEREVN